jgi:hypothetical protein
LGGLELGAAGSKGRSDKTTVSMVDTTGAGARAAELGGGGGGGGEFSSLMWRQIFNIFSLASSNETSKYSCPNFPRRASAKD